MSLSSFEEEQFALPGVADEERRTVLTAQLVESTRRSRYRRSLAKAAHSSARADPRSHLFDPLKAAVLHNRKGDFDQACWLVFLSVAFGKNSRVAWQLLQDIYRGADDGPMWTWGTINSDPESFVNWLTFYHEQCKATGTKIRFGNHRKREGLDIQGGVGATIRGYLEWVRPFLSHTKLFGAVTAQANGDPQAAFDLLNESLKPIRRFGRLARFDYLTNLADLDLLDVRPGKPYMAGAGGPLTGARLLFSNNPNQTSLSPASLDTMMVLLDSYVKIGMYAWEDGLCNWQKSPGRFKPFRG